MARMTVAALSLVCIRRTVTLTTSPRSQSGAAAHQRRIKIDPGSARARRRRSQVDLRADLDHLRVRDAKVSIRVHGIAREKPEDALEDHAHVPALVREDPFAREVVRDVVKIDVERASTHGEVERL